MSTASGASAEASALESAKKSPQDQDTGEGNPGANAEAPSVAGKEHVVQVRSEYLARPAPAPVATAPAASSDPQPQPQPEAQPQQQESKKRPRPEGKPDPENRLCMTVARGDVCTFGDKCKYAHDPLAYLATKPADLGERCYQYDTFGQCNNGLMCRFGGAHIDYTVGKSLLRPPELGGVVERVQVNVLGKDLQAVLRKKAYKNSGRGAAFDFTPYDEAVKLVDFRNKVYVAPLTTVGNLPFRRILKDYGADITCGEMAMATNLLGGQASEWALLRRHPSETVFGVQIAGAWTQTMSDVTRILNNEISSSFVDLNCGCPIDLLCDKGCGAALMNKPDRLLEIVAACCKQLTTRPMTVKIRTGWNDNHPSAHLLVPQIQKMAKGRVAAVFIHGRSRQARYAKLANWDYVAQVAQAQNTELPLIPVIGNGDIFSYHDWASHQALVSQKLEGDAETLGLCSCAMIGRGALIKPWLPAEIKQQAVLDVSASERLDMLKKFCSYGMEHWGSDQQGINTCRRFLLEWLSFLHRYVPAGLLERGSVQKMSQRPPHYFGRCDLETLLASPNSQDWVRLSEMLLGPVGEGFSFVAKHKSSAYAPQAHGGGGAGAGAAVVGAADFSLDAESNG